MPALMRCEKLGKRAARAGFEWPDVTGALGKLDGFSSTKRTKPLVVADLVNYARALSIDAPEELLPSGQKLLARCKGGADECSPEEVAELFKLSIRERDEL